MDRRQFLENLKQFCVLYGISSVLSEKAFAQAASPARMVNFIVKYTGGCTDEKGPGAWNFTNVLSPLANYQGQIVRPMGLNSEFRAPMNSHAAPQVSALSGSMTGFVMRETHYPKGNLENFSTGDGKSIDVLIGEKLQRQYKTKLPYLLISNNTLNQQPCTTRTSSWGAGGAVIDSITTIEGLTNEIASRLSCERFPKEVYIQRLKALEYVKSNSKVFNDHFLIDKDRFTEVQNNLQKNETRYQTDIANINSRGRVNCDTLSVLSVPEDTQDNPTNFNLKMNRMYDLAIIALQQNITRTLTFNLYMRTTHDTSHFLSVNPISDYYNASRFMQASVAQFIAKLKAANLYSDTLIFGNAGSCTLNNVHNYENLATYVINGGRSGVSGTATVRKPIGSLHLDILSKFGINYSKYGGTDHIYGVATKGNYF